MPLVPNRFKHAIRERRRQLGVWCTLSSPMVVEAVSAIGYDFVTLDMEHSPNDVPEVQAQMQACISGGGASQVIRLPWNDPVWAKRVLDAGGQTLMFPFVQTPEEAAQAVASTRYPPRGIRGVAGMTRANRYGTIPEYFGHADEEICVLVQIETRAAMARLEEICAVEGVDGIFIGPSDLSADMGRLGDIMHPDVQQALADGARRCLAAGKPVGIIAANDQLAKNCVDWDYTYIALGTDLSMMLGRAKALLSQFGGAASAPAKPSGY